MRRAPERTRHDDQGSALVLVLVLVIVAALIVLPVLAYAVAVMRENTVVIEGREQAEAVKGGFRYAMADPQNLYDTCTGGSAELPEPPGLTIPIETTCSQLSWVPAVPDDDLPWSIATTYAGVAPPTAGGGVIPTIYPGSGALDPQTWIDDSSTLRQTGKVFLPNLPVHPLTLRNASGFTMLPGFPTCRVYYPGTYKSAITINGPTYFASGVYYFEKKITLVGGASVVAGSGDYDDGCTDDPGAQFYVNNPPAPHNISGVGVTFVFGDEGQIVVDNSAGPVSFRMNTRYVQATDTGGLPSAQVSIMTVNGDLDPSLDASDPTAGRPLVLPATGAAELRVPLSMVDSVNPRPAPADKYLPSTLVPEPHAPGQPLNLRNGAAGNKVFNGSLILKWDAPLIDGGKAITRYTVSDSSGIVRCETLGQRSCTVTGLNTATTYQFQVVAVNEVGASVPSALSAGLRPNGSQALTAPPAPSNVRITQGTPPVAGESRYDDTFEITWDPIVAADTSTSSLVAPLDAYTALITDTDSLITDVYTCTAIETNTCTITGLPPADPDRVDDLNAPLPYLAQYQLVVSGTNEIAESSPTSPITVRLPVTGTAEYVAPVVGPHAPYTPPPIVDLNMSSNANAVTFLVHGYVSVPQGVVRVSLPAGASTANKRVELDGGVLAAWIVRSGANFPGFSMGLNNPRIQRVIRVETVVVGDDDVTSTAVVQINESGGWAVNSWVVQ